MTKYEWETELKKNIHRLPDDEIKRVLEYYGELFEDNIERGKSETQIINEFGNPVDVADKILSEYDGELKDESDARKKDGIFEGHDDIRIPGADAPAASSEKSESDANTPEKRETGKNIEIIETDVKDVKKEKPQERSETADGGNSVSSERLVLFVILNVITGFAFFIAAAVIWIVLCAATAACAAVGAGGCCAAVISVGVMCNGYGGSGLAQLGMGLLCIGVGIVLTVAAVKIIKLMFGLTRKCYLGLKNWLLTKKESNA